jgi:hypothetical protein
MHQAYPHPDHAVFSIFCASKKLGSLFIRKGGGCPFSHVATVDHRAGTVIEAVCPHGVIERPLHEFAHDKTSMALTWINVDDPATALAFARQRKGKRYDLIGAIGAGFNHDWQNPNQWYCSELDSGAIQAGGFMLFHPDVGRITPHMRWTHAASQRDTSDRLRKLIGGDSPF